MIKRKNVFLIVQFFLILALLLVTFNIKSANAASQVNILSHVSFFDSVGYLHIVGEVQNTGTSTLTYVQITATYYDLNGIVVGTSFTYADLDILGISEKSPFDIIFLDKTQAAKVDHYSLTTSLSVASPLPVGLQILSHSSYIDSVGYMHIVGEIKNTGTSKANYVQVISTCYNSQGNVVLTAFTYTQPTDVEPGQKAPFEIIMLYKDRVPLVASYSLTAQSSQYSLIPEFSSTIFMILVMMPLLAGIVFFRKKFLKTRS